MAYTNFGYCALTAIGIGIQGFMDAMHTVQLREELGLQYPDDGNGRIGKTLSDTEWNKFASYQNVHKLSMDYLPATTVMLLIGGINYPIVSSGFGSVYILGRVLYGHGYRKYGPEGRYNGNAILKIGILGLLVVSITSCLRMLELVEYGERFSK
eukprot:NODE_659_length_5444_cov_0.092423.p3 type:complete len:154 gc:universal NODE_659_length_5444_cov_0.092423:2925-2464(-)